VNGGGVRARQVVVEKDISPSHATGG